jgi:formylglycine-generating enzyme required for sulfatase activity
VQVEQRLGELARHLGESWWQEVILLLLKRAERPHLFVPLFRWIADHEPELFGSQSEMVDACIRDSAILRSEPFAHALSRFSAKPKEGSAMQAALYACVQALKRIEPGYFESHDSITQTLRKLGDKTLNELLPSERGTPSIVTRSSRAGIELVRIAGGRFRMGGTRHAAEQPIHEVQVPEFWLARTPVTNAQYQEFVRATGHAAPPAWKDPRFNAPDQPVLTVRWDDAQAFCAWAGLRLPSEAEWEYACRAGSTGEYCFGDDEERLAQYAWFDANSEGKSRPVGQKLANAFGPHDMHGDVWEWCEDSWHESHAGAPDDASAWVERGSSFRVLRGGSWNVPAARCRSASRYRRRAGDRNAVIGFRPASSSLD